MEQRFKTTFGQNPFQQPDDGFQNKANPIKNKTEKPTSKKVVGEYIDFEEIE